MSDQQYFRFNTSSTPDIKRRSLSSVLPSSLTAMGSSLLRAGACALVLASSQAQAFEFKVGEFDAFFDTVFSASTAMRTESAKHHGTADPTGNWTVFNDAGDIYSSPLSLLTDAGIGNGDFGLFTRFSYRYDYTIRSKDCTNCERSNLWPLAPAGFNGVGTPEQQLVDGIDDQAQNLAGKKFTLYDLFVYGNFRVLDRPVNVRVGKQVVSWGESNIMGGGISQMQNPSDLSKATTPGTEVKETLMPQETAYFNLGITDNISLEAYYTWNWRNSVFVPVGTFFSPFDFLGEGYNPDLFVRGIEYTGSNEPSGGQWGVNMHFILESLNFADLGFYYVRSHAYTGYIGLNEDYTPRNDPARDNEMTLGGYEWKYGEDQNTYGISLNGEALFGASFAMEFNLKQNFYDTRECRNLFGISGVDVPDIGARVGDAFGAQLGFDPATPYGPVIDGCDINASDVYTYLLNFTRSGGTDLLGADTLNLVFDASAVWITELEHGDKTDRRNLTPNKFGTTVDPGIFEGVDALDRPITDFSWGYAAVAGLVYNNVFANVNIAPTLIFVHHVEGYTPVNAGSLVENQRTVIAKVGFSYLSSSLDLQYVTWLGTAGTNDDRDNVSIVFKTSF